jgi:hypothetical protein
MPTIRNDNFYGLRDAERLKKEDRRPDWHVVKEVPVPLFRRVDEEA